MVEETPQAAIEEWELLQTRLKYLIRDDEKYTYLTRQEVIQEFGRWAPVNVTTYGKKNERRKGLRLNSSTIVLLASKVRRQRGDGSWEFDMESNIPVHAEALREFLNEAWEMENVEAK